MATHPPTFKLAVEEPIPVPKEGATIAIEAEDGGLWYWRIYNVRRFGPKEARAAIAALSTAEIERLQQRFAVAQAARRGQSRWRRAVAALRWWRR